jgi:6-phosphogluconate dehydrogenase
MGVSGVGKTTIGTLLSDTTNIPFFDGDDFHPDSNRDKMNAGQSLNDEDRKCWLQDLNALAKNKIPSTGAIIACSALKKSYRAILREGIEAHITFVHLTGSYELIKNRIDNRQNHYMPSSLLKSQFETLESPTKAISFSIELTPDEIVNSVQNLLFDKADFGLIGLGIMGKSLCRNLASKNIKISMYNRHVPGKEEHIATTFKAAHAELKNAKAFDNLSNFVHSLAKPRKVMLMVNAGQAVDYVIQELLPLLDKGDIIIDGGNSHFEDTSRRTTQLVEDGLHFIGAGVSGGEEGALNGPSIMPGGNQEAYRLVAPYLETIAAKDNENNACCTYIGPEGSGHYVKMVHNGIEYVEMQLLAEVYFLLKSQHKNPDEIASILEQWNNTGMNSYLLEITINILRTKEDNNWLIDSILDKAANKGTGNWTTVTSAKLGAASTMIATALFARYISSYKETRKIASTLFDNKDNTVPTFEINQLKGAYQLARIINHSQGFDLLKNASHQFQWNLDLSDIARIWTNGCIIRSEFMLTLIGSLKASSDSLLFNKDIITTIISNKGALKTIVIAGLNNNFALPCLSDALQYLNGISTNNSPSNMIQAQRDYFGAHTYERLDKEGNFHTNWNAI